MLVFKRVIQSCLFTGLIVIHLMYAGAEDTLSKSASPIDPLLQSMINEGIALTKDVRAKLPPPTFMGLDGNPVSDDQAAKSLQDIAGGMGVERFTRDSVVAPISLDIESIENSDGKRIGHLLDVSFVVSMPIETLRDSEAMKGLVGQGDTDDDSTASDSEDPESPDASSARKLTPDELDEAGIASAESTDSETFAHLQFPLLGQVVLRGVAHAKRSIWANDDPKAPVVMTWILDPRFTAEEVQQSGLSNQWLPINRNDVGRKVLGKPQPYQGIGGYIAISSVPGKPEASLIQSRLVLHEPTDWFAGRNQLRSKLPLIAQDRVRDLRRKLSKSK